ncbi:MAG: hypothetical protein ACRD59_18585 [Candidatus Acidiferrales bacterium]
MRTAARLLGFSAALLFCIPAICAQTNPPPPDPHELVTREPRTLSKQADRTASIELLEHARQELNMHTLTVPYDLKVSFRTSGATQDEGDGTMEEFADGATHWRWTAELQGSSIVRLGGDGHTYGTNASEPVPLRVQMLRSALHWPILRNAGARSVIRSAKVEHDGKELTCLLLSGSLPEHAAPRAWVENEYCIDAATGLLHVWSEAPGIYAVYDYTGATEFHEHMLPRLLTIFEGGTPVMEARVEGYEDAPSLDANLFKPTAEMVEAGGSFTLSGPDRFPMRVDPSDAPASTYFQPVIVHATLDAEDGRVLDAEALQNSDKDLSRAAMELVKSTSFPASGFQREVFINVQFHLPARELGGAPIYHSSVRWVILDRHGRTTPVRKSARSGS